MKRLHVLVIDDDPMFRCLISNNLSRHHRVATATDGQDGFFHALSDPPDVCILDIRMPGWNGLATLKAFRAQPRLEHLPVLVMTGYDDDARVAELMQAGADGLLPKSEFTLQRLLATIEELLSRPDRANQAQPDSGPLTCINAARESL